MVRSVAWQTPPLLPSAVLPRRSSTNAASLCFRCHRKLSTASRRPSLPHPYAHKQQRPQSTWTSALSAAQNLFNASQHDSKLPAGVKIDPLRTVAEEMKGLTKNIRQLIGSGHPVLDTVAKYYAQSEGKHLRPMLVLLISQASAPMVERTSPPGGPGRTIDTPISSDAVLSDVNPALASGPPDPPAAESDILPSQARLAEIVELIHTASLLHDDVIDNAETRRGDESANIRFGNKMAVLTGDFLLGRACIALARLYKPEVTELIASVIANLIEGEFMQLRNTAHDEAHPEFSEESTIPYYMHKTYLKSASLISKACRSAAILGECPANVVDGAYAYGKNLGLAFQLVDDMLDYTAEDSQLGKPAGADLQLGLATAPLLFAWRTHPELGELVGRKFSQEGDVSRARELVRVSGGVEQTRALAQDYADKAEAALKEWPDTQAKAGLIEMCSKVMQRRK